MRQKKEMLVIFTQIIMVFKPLFSEKLKLWWNVTHQAWFDCRSQVLLVSHLMNSNPKFNKTKIYIGSFQSLFRKVFILRDTSHFIFEINVEKRRIRQRTTLKLNDEFLNWLKIGWRCRHPSSESFSVGSASFRHWFQK